MVLGNSGKLPQVFAEHSQEILLEVPALVAQPVIHPDPPPFSGKPACVGQVGEMPGDGRLGKVEHRHQIADAQLALEQQTQNP